MTQAIAIGPIYNQQSNKIRSWQITINLFNAQHKRMSITGLDMNVPEGAIAEYYTTNGLIGMKMTDSSPTVIRSGKNLGKKNATNVLTQAYSDCSSKYRLKLKSGYTETKADQDKISPDEIPIPMALKSWKDFGTRLKYPLFVQPKLDGLRMIAMLDSDGKVTLKTRRRHDIPKFNKLRTELQSMYDRSTDKTIILDGELYSHGMNLQNISGIVRAETGRDDEKDQLQYWLFDCFCVKDSTTHNTLDPFDIRLNRLNQFMSNRTKISQLVINDTVQMQSEQDADEYYTQMITNGYEGVIYKSLGKPYEYSFNKEKRSSWYLKRKQQFDSEFEIVSYTEGKGKDDKCVVFVLKTVGGIEFNSVPNGTYEYRKDLFYECEKDFSQFKGKMAKVQFEDYSADKVPLRNRMIMIRDLSFD
jgi:ATP-dependent DNA ligase